MLELNPLSLREKNIEYIIEDRLRPSTKTALKAFGVHLLEEAYYAFTLPFFARPLRLYVNQMFMPETKENVREDVLASLSKKGYSKRNIKEAWNELMEK